MKKHDEHVAVRLDEITIARIDALRAKLAQPWGDATRSDVLREIIVKALDRAEQDPSFLRDPAEKHGPKT